MNEKLNTVFDIINATNTVSANRYLSHALGAEVAIIYNALLAKYAYYNKHDMIPDDWFYSTIDDLWRSTALSEKTQKRAIAILVKEGLIDRLGGLSEAIDCLYDMIENSSEKEKAENVSDNNRPL